MGGWDSSGLLAEGGCLGAPCVSSAHVGVGVAEACGVRECRPASYISRWSVLDGARVTSCWRKPPLLPAQQGQTLQLHQHPLEGSLKWPEFLSSRSNVFLGSVGGAGLGTAVTPTVREPWLLSAAGTWTLGSGAASLQSKTHGRLTVCAFGPQSKATCG